MARQHVKQSTIPQNGIDMNRKRPRPNSVAEDNRNAKRRSISPGIAPLPPEKRQKLKTEEDEYWSFPEVLSKHLATPLDVSINVIDLLDNDNTIPFIARYRKEMTRDMDVNKLRDFVETYENLKTVRTKVGTAIKTLSKNGKMNKRLLSSLKMVTTLEEFDHLYQPLKTAKTTLAGRARAAGLEPLALNIIEAPNRVEFADFSRLVNKSAKDFNSASTVQEGVKQILADIISKDIDILKFVSDRFLPTNLKLESKLRRSGTKNEDKNANQTHKFENYFDYRKMANLVEPHQILAINRGENLKILTVTVSIPDYLNLDYSKFAYKHITKNAHLTNQMIKDLLNESISESYSRFIKPLVKRRLRSSLTTQAEKSAVTTFSRNLRNLLLSSPVHGKIVMGIDPGFTKGCKIAIVSPIGDVLHAETLYLHTSRSRDESMQLASLIDKHRCDIIGIGNGTGCRETEEIVSGLINRKQLYSSRITYCIVNESGASIYSVSDEAASELPKLEPNLRSAVSLARRVIDPLSEYVKVEPKHLGVGMYQHDVSETTLKKVLGNTIEDCVSEVGVDVNTCNEIVLSKVAGLSKVKAQKILSWKKTNGTFINREQLKLVPSIGLKTYEQCAGFLKIYPRNSIKESRNTPHVDNLKPKSKQTFQTNVLDRTIIHPESYETVYNVLNLIGLHFKDIGTSEFIRSIRKSSNVDNIQNMALKLKMGLSSLKLIVNGLENCLDYDIRSEHQGPLFRTGIRDLTSLRPDMILTGKVMNVTDFGAFVDIGVGINGLLHRSKIKYKAQVSTGDVIEVKILDIEQGRERISLDFSH